MSNQVSNLVSGMTDKGFNNAMFEIFNNSDSEAVRRKLWYLYGGDLDGCRQWMAYCKHHNYFFSDEDRLEGWNGLRESLSVVVESTDEYNNTDTYRRFSRVERRNGVLKDVKYMLFVSCDENVIQYYEEKEMC